MRINPRKLALYSLCPRRFELQHLKKVFTGSEQHRDNSRLLQYKVLTRSLVEFVTPENTDRSEEGLFRLFNSAWTQVFPPGSSIAFSELKRQSSFLLRQIYSTLHPGESLYLSNRNLMISRNSFSISYNVQRLDRNPQLILYEYRMKKRPLDDILFSAEASIINHMLNLLTGLNLFQMKRIFLSGGKPLVLSRESFLAGDELEQLFERFDQAVYENSYGPVKNEFCRDCPAYLDCPAIVPDLTSRKNIVHHLLLTSDFFLSINKLPEDRETIRQTTLEMLYERFPLFRWDIDSENNIIAEPLTDSSATLPESWLNLIQEFYRTRIEKAENYTIAVTDALTGLFNRGFFDRVLDNWCNSSSPDQPLSMILLDIDHFKTINDTRGHSTGDAVLRECGRIIRSLCEESHARGFRYGGEELVILYPGPLDEAFSLAERVHKKIRETPFASAEEYFNITVSMGVGDFQPEENPLSFTGRVDEALYLAKNGGRDRIETAAKSSQETLFL